MQKVMLFMLSILMTSSSNACDICGCSSGGSYFGVLPHFQRSFIGVKYQYQYFYSKPHDLKNEQYSASKEYFQTTELWGRYTPHKRVQIFGFVPYRMNHRLEGTQHIYTNGIGDASVLINYMVLQKSSIDEVTWRQTLQLGAGIKVPSGKFDQVKNGLFVHQNIQLGSGSYDLPTNLIYTIRHKNTGLNAEINYRFNGQNDLGFSFGNKLNSSLRMLYWKETKQLTFLPQIGVSFEHASGDRQDNTLIEFTGGTALLAVMGCDMYYKKMGIGLHASQPLYQYLGNGYSQGKTRISANIIYLFNKKDRMK